MVEDNFVVMGFQLKKLIEKMSAAIMKEYDLRTIEIDILVLLADVKNIDTARDIMHIKHLSKAHISKSINNLHKKGFILLNNDTNDHRMVHIVLNKKAYEVVEKVKKVRCSCREVMYKNIPQEDIDMMRDTFSHISENVFSELEKY